MEAFAPVKPKPWPRVPVAAAIVVVAALALGLGVGLSSRSSSHSSDAGADAGIDDAVETFVPRVTATVELAGLTYAEFTADARPAAAIAAVFAAALDVPPSDVRSPRASRPQSWSGRGAPRSRNATGRGVA